MILALDTDLLVHWAVEGAEHHEAVRKLVRREVGDLATRLGLTPI